MLYKYIKKQPKVSWVKKQTRIWRILPFVFLFLGGLSLLSVFWPILSYEFKSQDFSASKLISPVKVLGNSATVIDYSQSNTWFPTAPSLPPQVSKITHYSFSSSFLSLTTILGITLKRSFDIFSGTSILSLSISSLFK